jgi:hypothetical protein
MKRHDQRTPRVRLARHRRRRVPVALVEYLDLDAKPGGRFEERWIGDGGEPGAPFSGRPNAAAL